MADEMFDRLARSEVEFLDEMTTVAASHVAPGEFYQRWIGPRRMIICRSWPHALFNRLLGLTDAALLLDIEVEEALRHMERICPLGACVELRAADVALSRALHVRGLSTAASARAKLLRTAELPLKQERSLFAARQLIDRELRAFALLLRDEFRLPDYMVNVVQELCTLERYQVYGAFDGPELVAAGCLALSADSARLMMGATRRAYRRQGLQSAIMNARIEGARTAGVSIVIGEANLPDPGETNSSLNNFRRLGFRIAYETYCLHSPPHARSNQLRVAP